MPRLGLIAAFLRARRARMGDRAGEPVDEPGERLGDRLRERLAGRLAARQDATAGDAAPPGGEEFAYGADPAQRLDVYRPAREGAAPIVLFFHGGGWQRGDKAMPRMVAQKVPHFSGRHGAVFVSANYRMLPGADVLQQADDVARAIAFVQAQAPAWGADATRLAVIGHSAGAHLAALVTADPSLAARHGAQPWRGTVALDSAALDMVEIMQRPHFRFYDPVFGTDPDFWRQASPMHRLAGPPVAPMLMVCSAQRDDSLGQAEAFAARANALGGQVRVLPVDLSHRELNENLGPDAGYTGPVDDWLRRAGMFPGG